MEKAVQVPCYLNCFFQTQLFFSFQRNPFWKKAVSVLATKYILGTGRNSWCCFLVLKQLDNSWQAHPRNQPAHVPKTLSAYQGHGFFSLDCGSSGDICLYSHLQRCGHFSMALGLFCVLGTVSVIRLLGPICSCGQQC